MDIRCQTCQGSYITCTCRDKRDLNMDLNEKAIKDNMNTCPNCMKLEKQLVEAEAEVERLKEENEQIFSLSELNTEKALQIKGENAKLRAAVNKAEEILVVGINLTIMAYPLQKEVEEALLELKKQIEKALED